MPAEITVSILDSAGRAVRRLCQSQLTRPAPGDFTYVYWDGKDSSGVPLPDGAYTIRADAYVCGTRQRVEASVSLLRDQLR